MKSRSEILKIALAVSLKAGAYLRKSFYTNKKFFRKKGTNEWQTPADLESEERILKYLEKKDPTSGILSEESGWIRPKAKNWWCVDPLDGTSNFIRGIPYFSVSIAYFESGVPTVGVVYDPMRKQVYTAQKGKGAFFQNKRINIKKNGKKADIDFFTLFAMNMSSRSKIPSWLKKSIQGAKLRNFGSLALQLCYVAQRNLDFCFSDSAHIWDIAAGEVILAESGGKLLHFSKKGILPIKKSSFLLTPSRVVPFVAINKSHIT